MIIARILTRLNLGGPARQVLASDPRLGALGYAITVFAGQVEPGEGDLMGALADQGVRVVRVPGLQRQVHPWRDREALGFLRRELRTLKPNLVHTHASKAGVLGRRLAHELGVPSVHTFHGHVLDGHFGPFKNRILALMERHLAQRTTQLVAVSNATADELAKLGVAPRGRFEVVYGGSDLEPLLHATRADAKLRETLGIDSSAWVVGVLGRLAPIKAPLAALAAFRLALPGLGDAHLVFLGDGALRPKLEQELETLPQEVSARVHLAGAWVNMADVLPDLDCLLSASRHEGLPIAFVEGGAAGIPAVATPVGGVGEFLEHGVTGLLGRSPSELAAGLVALACDRALTRRLGEAARERARIRHSAEALTQRLHQLYQTIAGVQP